MGLTGPFIVGSKPPTPTSRMGTQKRKSSAKMRDVRELREATTDLPSLAMTAELQRDGRRSRPGSGASRPGSGTSHRPERAQSPGLGTSFTSAVSYSSVFNPPQGLGRNAPARVRAHPAYPYSYQPGFPGSRPSSSTPVRPSSSSATRSTPAGPPLLSRPPSAPPPSTLGLSSIDFESEEDFATELLAIGMINTSKDLPAALRRGNATHASHTVSPPTSPQAFQVAFRGTQSSSPAPQVEAHEEDDDDDDEDKLVPAKQSTGAVGRPIHVPYRPDLRAKMSADTNTHTHLAQKPMSFRDYQLLAEVCQRAGKARMEAHAFYKMGELLAVNRETLEKSLPYFMKFLNICRRLNDLQGEAKALNCVGIVYQELGTKEHLQQALEYHQQHSEVADAAGIFIANTNLGLIYARLGELQRSMEHHKQALQFAVRAGDKQAEALALANLGLVGRNMKDLSTAKVCIERHLELSNDLKDTEASCDAYEQLGLLSTDKRDWAPASNYLLQAMDISARQGKQDKTNSIRCKIGYVNGTMRLDDHFRSIAKMMGARPERRRVGPG